MYIILLTLLSIKNMENDNRRKFQRIDFDGKVDLKFVNYSYDSCPVKNISLTGLFIEGNFLKRKAINCHVQIFHKDKNGNNSLRALAKVVRKNNEGLGLQFTAMTFENYLLLQTTLINKAKESEPILRELPENSPFLISNL